jgi:hypothetical protein
LKISNKSPGPPPLSSSSPSTCSALLPLLPPAVLRPWPPLCRHRRATSCWSEPHASSSHCPGLAPLPSCPLAHVPRCPEPPAGRHAPHHRRQLLLTCIMPLLALRHAQLLLCDLLYYLEHPRPQHFLFPSLIPHRTSAAPTAHRRQPLSLPLNLDPVLPQHRSDPLMLYSPSNFALPLPSPVLHSSGQYEPRAALGSSWAARSEPSCATITPQLALHQPREALRPLRWSPSASHQLLDKFPAISTRRRSASPSTHRYRAPQPSPRVPAAPHHPAEATQ